MLARRTVEVLAAAALAAAPVASQAQLGFGLRVGYAPAVGESYGGFENATTGQRARFSLDLESQIPIQLDVLYRLRPALAAGAYVSYGFADPAHEAMDGACMPGSPFRCSATVVRAGVQAIYTFAGGPSALVPWVGAGAGWEWTTLEVTGTRQPITARMNGAELLGLQAGADYRVTRWLGLGPYVGYSFGWYRPASTGIKGLQSSEGAIHSWMTIGLRGMLEL